MRLHYEIKGMSCAACVSHVERAVRSVLSDTDTFTVSLLINSVSLLVSDDVDTPALEASLSHAVKAAGYELITAQESSEKEPRNTEFQRRLHSLILSAVLTLILMYFSMGGMLGLPIPPFLTGAENGIWMALLQLSLTVPVLLLNRRFFVGGFRALLHLSPNMDSLIAIGAGASVLYGSFAIVMILTAPSHEIIHSYLHDLYFESAAMILTLVSLGKLLEGRAKDRAADAVKSLARLSPRLATVLRDGKTVACPVEELQVDDLILIRAGEWIPIDGVVTEGNGSADESALTGESMPVEKQVGDAVRAACVLTSGALTVRAECVGQDTSLSRIIRLLEDAAASKAPIARVADRVSGVFVPIVMGISLVTFTLWMLLTGHLEQALRSAIAVLVISCPCALGLATPTAITVGIGRGAGKGILFRDAESLEKLCDARTVMFDKTGTLTEGRPTLTDCILYEDADPTVVLSSAAAIERLSAHPLAQAVFAGAEILTEGVHSLTVTDFRSLVGVGAEGRIGSSFWRIGKPDAAFWESDRTEASKSADNDTCTEKTVADIRMLTHAAPDSMQADFKALEADGKTVILVTRDGSPLCIMAISDRIRPESASAVRTLRDAGVRCVMLTGDNERTAAAVARTADLDGYHASLLPEDKERLIRASRESGTVVMVGDGINDSPALVSADVGIAVGAGTDVAIDSAGVVLSSSSLSGVADAYFISRATIRIIKQNLFWALFYNAICIPIAAGVFFPFWGWQLSPMLASAAMSFSSVCVVSNALRLRKIPLASDRSHQKGDLNMFGKKELVTHTIRVEGMMCPRCVAHVKTALEAVKGVKNVTVDLDAKTAVVDAPATLSRATLTAAITAAGYEVVG